MGMDVVLTYLASLNPIVGTVLHILGSLVVIMTVYVKLTPSPNDDSFITKLEAIPVLGDVIAALINFSYIQRK